MPEVVLNSNHGSAVVLSAEHVSKLRAGVRGSLLLPGDAGYDDARRIHNGMIDRRPALILRCAGSADVIHAVRLVAGVEVRDTCVNRDLTAVTVEFLCHIRQPACTLRIVDRFAVNEAGRITDRENFFDPRDVTDPGWREQ